MSNVSIQAHLPGIFYRRSAPDAPLLKEEGEAVKEGDTIGIIEVMKSFHEVQSTVSGDNIQFKLDDSDDVMPGQVIAMVDINED